MVKENAEILDLMDVLKQVGDEGGRSFYTTRNAEIEFLGGDRRLARTIAEEAISRTPNIFEPRRIYATILLSERNFSKVNEVLSWMRDEVNAPEPGSAGPTIADTWKRKPATLLKLDGLPQGCSVL